MLFKFKKKIMTQTKLNKVVFVALLGLGILFTSVSCKCDKKNQVATETKESTSLIKGALSAIAGKLDAVTGNFIYDTGELFTLELPNGLKLDSIGKNSTEAKLFNFLNDSKYSVNDDLTQGWITFDRVYFNTNQSSLTAESNKQVKNIALILSAFPNAEVKIGGYTDNTGTDEINKTVSTERANQVKNELVNQGIAIERISAEGYGQEFPVCPANDTPECKAQNRRVDIRVAKK